MLLILTCSLGGRERKANQKAKGKGQKANGKRRYALASTEVEGKPCY
jgi:hypothetical protein